MSNPMNREAFVMIIKALKEQKEREEAFSEAIQQAFVNAGELAEFHTPDNFTPPTNVMVDKILEALSYAFVGENQTAAEAYDHINYFFYELDLMNYMITEPVSPEDQFVVHSVPAYYFAKDGAKLPLATPEDLYDSLVYEMTAARPVETKTPTETIDPALDNPMFRKVYDRVVKLLDEHLGLSEYNMEIHPTSNICDDFGMASADSLDCVEIIMGLEKEFGITFPDDEWDKFHNNATPLGITKWITEKLDIK